MKRLLCLMLMACFGGAEFLAAQATAPRLQAEVIEATATAERSTLNRTTGILTSTVELRAVNRSGKRIDGPVHAILSFKTTAGTAVTSGITVPGSLAGFGQAPWQLPYFDLTPALGADAWQPGETLILPITFSRNRTLQVLYEVGFAGRINQDPVVNPGGPYAGTVGGIIVFTGAAEDPDGDPLAFSWNFGDGSTAPTARAEHAFTRAGVQQVSLTADDGRGGVVSREVTALIIPSGNFALAHTRAVDGTGHPLPSAEVEETGPQGTRTVSVEDSGFVSLGAGAGDYLWKFTAPGYRPVWRQSRIADGEIKPLPSPWLAAQGAAVELSVLESVTLGGGTAPGSVRVIFPAGAFTQPLTGRLTELGPQTLPFPPGTGWSPLGAFHLALPEVPLAAGAVRMILTDSAGAGEVFTLVQFDEAARQWNVLEHRPNGVAATAEFLFDVTAAGTYAVLVRDTGASAPAIPALGQPLEPGTPQDLRAAVAAVGAAVPAERPASTDPRLAASVGEAVFMPVEGMLPSGSWFKLGVQETYDLNDGTGLRTPDYDTTVYAYRRPAGRTLQPVVPAAGAEFPAARFPLRPRLLFSPAELREALVQVDVLPPLGDGAAALSAEGGLLESGGIRITVPPAALGSFAAGSLRALDPAGFAGLTGQGTRILGAFEFNLSGLAPGSRLGLEMTTAAVPETDFLLTRLVSFPGGSGLAPVQRLRSNAAGLITDAEPANPPRLPGLNGPGQYLIVQLPAAQGLTGGTVRTGAGETAAGIGVRVTGQPWLSLTGPEGRYLLTSPAGTGTVLANHPTNGDGAAATFSMSAGLEPQTLDLTLGALAPRILATTPADGATKVSAVTPVSISFSEPLNPATVPQGAVTVTNPHGVVVEGTLTLSLAGTMATFLPLQPLEQAARYTVEVAATVQDRGGLPLEGTRSCVFTVLPFTERPAGAQLVIYEPDAAAVPASVLDQLVGYDPAAGLSLVVAKGTAGVADPEAPVILVNETTGQTATVLSKPDGSFASFIEAAEEDFVSAVFVNANGSRVTVPATRQVFDDGRVGLYRQGGILEAESDAGVIEVAIEPEAIPGRSVFEIKAFSTAQLRQATGGVLPDNGTVALPGITIAVEGDRPDGDAEISIPVDPATLGLDPSLDPERAPFAITMPMAVGDTVIYVTMDNMRYENGRLITNTCPFKGVYSAAAVDNMLQFGANFLPGFGGFAAGLGQIFVPILISSRFDGTTINGTVAQLPVSNIELIERARIQQLALLPLQLFAGQRAAALDLVGSMADFTEEMLVNVAIPVQGALVAQRHRDEVFDGRVKPGMVCAISDANGCYSLVSPALTGKLVATHPRLGRGADVGIGGFDLLDIGTKAFLARNLFFGTPDGVFRNLVPRLAISHSPLNPAIGEPVTLQVDAFTAATSPATISIGGATSVETLVLGQQVSMADLVIAEGPTVEITPGHMRFTATLTAEKALLGKIRIFATSVANPGAFANPDYLIAFGLSRPPVANPLTPADPDDEVNPRVVSVLPPAGHFLYPGQPIEIRFSEPVDRAVLTAPDGVTLNAGGLPPALILSQDQQVLRIHPRTLPAGGQITLTVGTALRDLAGNPLLSAFTVEHFVGPLETFDLSGAGAGVTNAGGSVLDGSILYVLDRGAVGGVRIFDVSNPGQPVPLGSFTELDVPAGAGENSLNGAFSAMDFPRDLTLIRNWSHVPGLSGGGELPAVDRPILAVTGGTLGAFVDALGNAEETGQFLTLLDVSDPAQPRQLHNIRITVRPAAVAKLRWSPPYLIYLENSADTHFISFVDLQELLIGFSVPRQQRPVVFANGQAGADLNLDGDYTDPVETRPYPKASDVTEFFGFKIGYDVLPLAQQRVEDFAFKSGTLAVVRSLSGIAPPIPPSAAPEFRLILTGGQEMPPQAGFLAFDAAARPKRLELAPAVRVMVGNLPENRNLAFVSLSPDADGIQKLAVIDWTNAAQPSLVRKLEFPEGLNLGLGFLQSPVLRPDGLLELATTRKLLLIDPATAFSEEGSGGLHPSVLAVLPSGGSANVTIGVNDTGLRSVGLGQRVELTMGPPALSFVQGAGLAAVADPAALRADPDLRREVLNGLKPVRALRPTRYRTQSGVSSTISPPSPLTHYHVMVRAPGGSGAVIPLLLESLNEAGAAVRNKGVGYPSVRASDAGALSRIGDEPMANVDVPVPTLTAYRLSDDVKDEAYNLYLSDPIVVIREKISRGEIETLTTERKRVILWSESLLRAAIDVTASGLMGTYASEIDSVKGVFRPRVAALASTLPGGFIPGSTPPPMGGAMAVPGTFGLIDAASGEFRHATADLELPSRRLPIVFERTATNHALVSSGFGRGWDFNYNQRAIELKPELIPPGERIPVTARGGGDKDLVAESLDIILSDGAGNAVVFKNMGKTAPPGVANDPLAAQLGWDSAGGEYYLPAEAQKGIFDLFYRFPSGEMVRLTPEGTQFHYRADGRLTKVEDRYPDNHHLLDYNDDGELMEIRDLSVQDGRSLRIGYFRKSGGGTVFAAGVDKVASRDSHIGRICTLLDFAGRRIDFEYDEAGMLGGRQGVAVTGSNGGFSGRPRTTYQIDPQTRAYVGVIAGTGAHGGGGGNGGTALAVAATVENQVNERVATATQGAGGAVSIRVPAGRDATNVSAGSTEADHADASATAVSYDANGYPASVSMSGAGAGSATYETIHNERGLPETVVYPEGNSITYVYEPESAPFRARANVVRITRNPGPRGGPVLTSEAAYDYRYNLPSGGQKDFNGNTITVTLRGDGRNMQSVQYPRAGTHTVTRNDYGQVEDETTVEGITTGIGYDSTTGYVTSRELGGTLTTGFDYNNSVAARLGMPTGVNPPAGSAIGLEYDDRLQRTRMTRGSQEEKMGYDENGNVVFLSRALGDGANYEEVREYSQINFLTKLTVRGVETAGGSGELVTSFTPDSVFRIKEMTLPGGEIRKLFYDHLGHVIRTELGSYAEVYGRDLHGNAKSLTKGGDLVQEVIHDGHDRPIEIKNKTGAGGDDVTVLDYFGKGELKSRTVTGDEGGTVLETLVQEVDEMGRPLLTEIKGDQTSATVTADYQGDGGRSAASSGPVDTFKATHDEAGRPVEQVSSLRRVDLTPDPNGNVTRIESVEDGTTFVVDMVYNGLDQLTKTSDPVGTIMEITSLRADGLPRSVVDGGGHGISKTYSRLGELLTIDKPEQLRFAYQFDANRQPVSVQDRAGSGNATAYADGTLRPTSTTWRDGSSTGFNAPDGRNLPTVISIPGGNINASYDLQGRAVSLDATYSGGGYRLDGMKYDALGRLRAARYGSSGQFSLIMGYDKLGPLTSSTYDEPGGPYPVGSTIRQDGARLTLGYPSGVTVTETRQPSGRLQKVEVAGSLVWEATAFAGAEQPATVNRGNSMVESCRYDGRRRLLSRRFTGPGNTMLEDLRFRYDGADNVLARQALAGGGRADVFEYDAANRLTRAEYGVRPGFQGAQRNNAAGLQGGEGFAAGWFARRYAYDGGGLDLLQGGELVNPDNLPLQTAGPGPFAVPHFASILGSPDSFLFSRSVDGFDRSVPDPLGNASRTPLLVRPPTGPLQLVPASLTYNAHANLVRIQRDDGVTIEGQYRPDKLLHHRKVTGGPSAGERALVWHEGRLLEEYDLTNGKTLLARYYYANDDPPVAADLRQSDGSLRRVHYLHDHLLSVVAVADDTGRILERVRYDAWGQPVITVRDEDAPRIAEVRRDGSDLLVVMSEPVLPPLTAQAGTDLQTANGASPSQAFRLQTSAGQQIPQITYQENAPGHPFGSVFRLTPTGNLSGNVTVQLVGGGLTDPWGNATPSENIAFTMGAGPLLASGTAAAGATAPVAVARSQTGNPWLWQGQWFDYDAGLTYMRARHYDPVTGHFLQRDPMQYEDSGNLYAGMGNNTVSFRDPLGLGIINKLLKNEPGTAAAKPLQHGTGPGAGAVASEKKGVAQQALHGDNEETVKIRRPTGDDTLELPSGGIHGGAGIHDLATQKLSIIETAGRTTMTLADGRSLEMIDLVWKTKGGRPGVLVKTSDGWTPFYLTSGTNRPHLAPGESPHPWLPFDGFDILETKEGKRVTGWLNKGKHPYVHAKGEDLHGYSSLEQKMVSDALQKRWGLFGKDTELNDVVLGSRMIDEQVANRAMFNLGARKDPKMRVFSMKR